MWGKQDPGFQQTDVILAVAVIGIVLLLVIPLPPFFLDLLLCINIVFSVMVLLLTLYVEQALEFNAFPSALLFLTLYRLGLNIASTRMILTRGEGGHIIQTFGEFVTQGHVGVGLILFALLTTINFVVVTKGAGRVAEVAARFTLEALPGKQMAIEGELSSGVIGQEEAKRQQEKIQQEAEFYGAMDGASKFVRGDAIASVLITCVNILGGLVLGCCIHHYSLSESLSLFVKLTVGDGLVSQIPALLVSVGAGIMVTRCGGQSLGKALGQQLFHHPKVLAITGVALLVLGCVPGMPLLVMGPMAAILLLYARVLTKQQRHEQKGVVIRRMHVIEIGLGVNLSRRVHQVKERIHRELQALEIGMGFTLPPFSLQDNIALAPSAFEMKISGILTAHERTDLTDLAGKISATVARYCHELLCRQDVVHMVEQARKVDAAVVNELIPKKISIGDVLAVLQNLLKEQVSIRNFTLILEGLADALNRHPQGDCDFLTQAVRERLGRGISETLFGMHRIAYIITLDPKVEQMLEVTMAPSSMQTHERMRPQLIENIARQLLELQQAARLVGGKPVVITQAPLRLRFKRLIEGQMPDLPVMAYSELARDIQLHTIGMVTKESLSINV